MRRLARAQPHLRSFAFWNSHIEPCRKAGNPLKATSLLLLILILLLISARED